MTLLLLYFPMVDLMKIDQWIESSISHVDSFPDTLGSLESSFQAASFIGPGAPKQALEIPSWNSSDLTDFPVPSRDGWSCIFRLDSSPLPDV